MRSVCDTGPNIPNSVLPPFSLQKETKPFQGGSRGSDSGFRLVCGDPHIRPKTKWVITCDEKLKGA